MQPLVLEGLRFTVSGGTLNLDNGTIAGTGTINGNVAGTGFYAPGDPGAAPGELTIAGTALWAGSGGLDFEIGDPTGTNPVADAGTA